MTIRRFVPSILPILLAIVVVGANLSIVSEAATVLPSNLLVNGDFEGPFLPVDGTAGYVATGWTPFVLSADTPPSYAQGEGWPGKAQAITGSGIYSAGLYQRVSGLQIGQPYIARVHAYPPTQGSILKLIGVDPLGGTDPSASMIAWSNAHQVNTWMLIEVRFTAISNSATIFLKAEQGNNIGPATVLFDNASLKAVPSAYHVSLPLLSRDRPISTATFTPSPTFSATATPSPSRTASPTPSAGMTVTATPSPTPTISSPWAGIRVDPRIFNFMGLGPLNVQVTRCPTCRYQLRDVFITVDGVFDGAPAWAWDYVGIDGAGGATHLFIVVYRHNGQPFSGKSVVMFWNGGQDVGVTKSDGSYNWFVNGKYYPDQGQTGPYGMYPLNGEIIRGGGLPYGNHVSLWAVYDEKWGDDVTPTWTLTPTATPTGPTPTRTATPAVSFTPTASPSPSLTPTSSIAGPVPFWDSRLDALNIRVTPLAGRDYQLYAAFMTVDGSWDGAPSWAQVYADVLPASKRADRESVFGVCLDEDNRIITSVQYNLAWPPSNLVSSYPDPFTGWGNQRLTRTLYNPSAGQSGPYTWWVAGGDRLAGLGLPNGDPRGYSFFAVWKPANALEALRRPPERPLPPAQKQPSVSHPSLVSPAYLEMNVP